MKPASLLPVCLLLLSLSAQGRPKDAYEVASPDGRIVLYVDATETLIWSVHLDGEEALAPSEISLILERGRFPGIKSKVGSHKVEEVDTRIKAINYKKTEIRDHCNELTLLFRDKSGVIFRVYDNAVAYRFVTDFDSEIVVKDEEANFNFTRDYDVLIPYLREYRDGNIYCCSFESPYTRQKISEFRMDSLAFLPTMICMNEGKKAVIIEADLEDYPGMLLKMNGSGMGYRGVYAPYPLEFTRSGRGLIPAQRAGYIARTYGARKFPWRAVIFSREDRELLNNDLVQILASPNRITDPSWIKPGQVTWEWWNDWNISGVDFVAGINTKTYLHYIDFAAENGIPYLLMDEGWSDRGDIFKLRPEVDLQQIIEHGREKQVDVILWATWYQVISRPEEVFSRYSEMGVRGFKIDFLDRDDQLAVASTYELAAKAAKYRLMLDFHGIFKPTGLQRTYPNVVGFEGIKGMEYYKWSRDDGPGYEVTIPYIRMLSGPMDYTPGAMRNTNRRGFAPIGSNPMSMGTRCHQLAMYVIYEAPLQMLADSPTAYRKEQECTDFITRIPVVFDETVPLEGEVGEFAAIARRKGNTWYIGAMTNWKPRDLTLDLSFLGQGSYRAVIFKDGVNAHRQATDYVREEKEVRGGQRLTVHLSTGGGWSARLEKVNKE